MARHRNSKSKKMLELILKISRKVSSSLELHIVINTILKAAKSALDSDHSAIFLISEGAGPKKLLLTGAEGFNNDQIKNLELLGGWERINKELIRKGKAILVNDIHKSSAFKNKRVPFTKGRLPLDAFLAVPLKSERGIIGALIVSSTKRKGHFSEEDKKLLHTLANHVAIAIVNAELYKRIKELFTNTIASLAAAIDAKDPYTRGHSDRVARYAVAIASEMSTSQKFLDSVKLGAILHDIGKIGIKDAVLLKKTQLNTQERKLVEKHPLIGSKIVKSVIKNRSVIRGIEEHHERFDGKGYPRGVKGKRISPEGKIIAVADVYDTLTTSRPYHNALSPESSLREIVRCIGTQFDTRVVEAFKRSFSKYPDIWKNR